MVLAKDQLSADKSADSQKTTRILQKSVRRYNLAEFELPPWSRTEEILEVETQLASNWDIGSAHLIVQHAFKCSAHYWSAL